MRRLPRLGFSTRLALIVGAGFAALQVIMLVLVLAQHASQQRAWRYPATGRLAAAAELVDATPEADRTRLLRALSSREARFSVGDVADLEGYRIVERPNQMRRARSRNPSLQTRQFLILAADNTNVPAEIRWLTPAGERKVVALGLKTGGHLLVEPTMPGRRRLTVLAILASNALLGVIVVAIVWILTRRLAAPLQVIAERAATFASDLSAPPMDATSGPPEARRMADAFNSLRSDVQGLLADRVRMLAAVAHDLKTYLTRLHMRTGAIENPVHREAADRDIRQMSALIEDLITAARGEERPAVVALFDLGKVIADVIAARRDIGVDIRTAGPMNDLWVRADAAGLRRALDNLVDNALSYGGDCELAVSHDAGHWRLAVVDHGPGLPPGFSDVALEPFTRAEPSRNRQTGGAGLGLFIASTLVRQSHGDLVLLETPGGGLTAIIRIPVAATGR